MFTYDTVSAATEGLRGRGYTLDFSLGNNCLVCDDHKVDPADFDIVEFYRFEGNSDPADEAAVYAVEGKGGLKGVLVTGYGPTSETLSPEMARKLQIHLK